LRLDFVPLVGGTPAIFDNEYWRKFCFAMALLPEKHDNCPRRRASPDRGLVACVANAARTQHHETQREKEQAKQSQRNQRVPQVIVAKV